MDTVNRILSLFKLSSSDILNIYPYGSRVYGTATESSDWDYIIVTKSGEPKKEIKVTNMDATLYSQEQFQIEINNHEISVLECLSLPPEQAILQNVEFSFELDLQTLRHSISSKASNSFVKAKKKLTVTADYNEKIALKSLFHSLKIPMFGSQIADNGKIIDFSCANHFLKDITEMKTNNWEELKSKYQPIYNQLNSEFKKKAPKR